MAVALRLLRLGTAALIITAVAVQYGNRASGSDAGNFFSFFTIQSNLLAAAVLLLLVARGDAPPPRWLSVARGAVTLYLVITFVVVILLLDDAELQVTLPWVDTALHKISPIILMIDWLLDPPRPPIATSTALWWLVFPLVWAIYTLIRGEIVDWYPYPFINVAEHGYGTVLLTCVVMAVCFALAAIAVAATSRRPRRVVAVGGD